MDELLKSKSRLNASLKDVGCPLGFQ